MLLVFKMNFHASLQNSSYCSQTNDTDQNQPANFTEESAWISNKGQQKPLGGNEVDITE